MKIQQKIDDHWLNTTASIHKIIASAVHQATEGRMLQRRAIQIPNDPLSGFYYCGVRGLVLMHEAYERFLSSKVFDARFSAFYTWKEHACRVKKGARGVPVISQLADDVGRYCRDYDVVFSAQALSQRVIPTTPSVITQQEQVQWTLKAMESFVSSAVQARDFSVVFINDDALSFDVVSQTLYISAAMYKTNTAQFYTAIFHYLMMSCLDVDDVGHAPNSEIVCGLGSLMLCNLFLTNWDSLLFPEHALLQLVDQLSPQQAMVAMLNAEQTLTQLLSSKGACRGVRHLHHTALSVIRDDFLCFSAPSIDRVPSRAKATWQTSEKMHIDY